MSVSNETLSSLRALVDDDVALQTQVEALHDINQVVAVLCSAAHQNGLVVNAEQLKAYFLAVQRAHNLEASGKSAIAALRGSFC